MAKKRLFRLKGGTHVHNDGSNQTVYRKGDVIESEEDLSKKFLNKFEEVKTSKVPPVTKRSSRTRGTPPPLMPADETDGEDLELKDNPIPEDEEVDDDTIEQLEEAETAEEENQRAKGGAKKKLEKMKAKKAAKAEADEEEEEEPEEDEEVTEEEDEEEPNEEEEEEVSKFGEDVTSEHATAKSADLKVFFDKKKKNFTVVDADEPDKALHKEKLADKKAVGGFLKKYLKNS